MKILLMGQQLFGKAVLEKIHQETNHTISAVCCFKNRTTAFLDPVREYALAHNFPIIEVDSFKDQKLIQKLKQTDADLCIMAYVTKFITKEVRDIPTHGTICFHPSLLPRHRGPSAINWAIIHGSKNVGVTIFYPDDGLDEGDILLQKEITISDDETLGDVYFNKIFPLGVDACIEAADLIEQGKAPRIPQEKQKGTYESWCRKNDARINWERSGEDIYRLIRGCNPKPGAWSKLKNDEYTFFDTKFINKKHGKTYYPGQVVDIDRDSMQIAVKDGFLLVSKVKLNNQNKQHILELTEVHKSKGEVFV
ncbi:MAG: methionyl-tRNA formyltransferase [Gammaproteobacteria bacterium]|nr:methionyl-tRNA formyltransferase [Gammaproteobacteria bacterium]